MKEITNQRILTFIKYVEETQPKEVLNEFTKEIHKCDDPASANLTLMLKRAIKISPGASKRAALEHCMNQGALHHCCS